MKTTKGYKQIKIKGRRRVPVGSLMIDKRYLGIRIKKATGTDSPDTYRRILVALSYLKKENEKEAFLALKHGSIDIAQILEWYEHKHTKDRPWIIKGKVLSDDITKWINKTGNIKDRTKLSYKYHVKVVLDYAPKFGDTISSLPRIVEAYKTKCDDKKTTFNRFRSTCLSYASSLSHGGENEIWKSIKAIKPYKKKDVLRSKKGNPFTPLEIDNLFHHKKADKQLKQLIYWLCLTGIRPEEYTRHGFKNDGNVIEIYGEKTAGSYERLVPMFFKDYDPQAQKLGITYWKLRQIFRKHCPNHTPRDTRRTFSIWCQQAGIEENHTRQYMGHVPTQLADYQRDDIKKNWADKDRKKLEEYLIRSRKEIPAIDDTKQRRPKQIDDLGSTASTYTKQQIEEIMNEWLRTNHPKHIRRQYKVKLIDESYS